MDFMTIKFNEKWNIIPIQPNNKIPIIKWLNYQEIKFPRKNLHLYEPSNYAVICGRTSNNLVIIDFDLKDKSAIGDILEDLAIHFTDIFETFMVETPHGLHIYYYIDGDIPLRKTQLKSPHKNIKHIDILGEGGYALTSPSKINDNYYQVYENNNPITITRKVFNKLLKFYTLQEEDKVFIPKKNTKYKLNRLRKPFQDILTGKVNIEKLAKETGMDEHIYWKYTFVEGLKSGVIRKPQEFYKLLREGQPSFDVSKTEAQLTHHVKASTQPLTTNKLKRYFPNHEINEPLEDWVMIAKELIEEFDIITMEDTGDLMIRKGNIYTLDTADFYKTLRDKLTSRMYGKQYKNKRASLLTWIEDGTRFSRDNFCYDRWIINLANGYYDVKGKRFIPHEENKDRIFFYEIPFEYKKGIHKCPNFSRLIFDWLGQNNVVNADDIFEMIGYSMTMNTDMKMAFFIYGEAHTGKSSFQNILGAMIGDRNIASTEIQRMNRDQFGTDDLQFKIVNMIGDMSDKIVNDVSAFKMITGGDTYVPAEAKGGKRYRFHNTVKVWYNGNYLPMIKNMHDDAFFERWILINFPHQFPVDTKESIKAIWETIIDDELEMQGILHKALAGAIRLYERGYFRPELRVYTRHVWQYQSDDVYAFIYDKCIKGEDESIESIELHDDFNRYLFKRKKRPLSAYKIKSLLENHGIFKLRSSSGDRVEFYNGIGWKSDEPQSIQNSFSF